MRNTKSMSHLMPISCPSCGRTLFDLKEISAQIREKTSNLPGVLIAITGCIVNGPGEMADAVWVPTAKVKAEVYHFLLDYITTTKPQSCEEVLNSYNKNGGMSLCNQIFHISSDWQ
ncbi:hypothetical protein NE237_002977 [Protea cynaroides]|uniref:IspG C-terminal domain-containing protein n=1 Tax=Protea cynaroides TaxID=273540 RepID=A0A9Q0KFZ4_9MAGN|nr:hypothetical protein NE237_002977 [Protea cynaroides]